VSDYFSTVRQDLGDAVERRSHLRWYSRLRLPATKPLAVVVAALVVATPAVGAVTNWFSFGQPNVGPPAHAGIMYGVVKPGSSRLLPLRVRDPLGGPPWGLRMVRTSRGDTCVQLGRVEDGQIGSLGIDDAWDNDGKFHAISAADSAADQCGSTDAAGHGFVNVGMIGTDASADIYHRNQGSGRASRGCIPPQHLSLIDRRHHPIPLPRQSSPTCPPGGARVIFFGMLGPDATSVTYRKPGGGLTTERTAGGVGEYLLVFPYNASTCYEYSHSAGRSVSCDSELMPSASPGQPGAITKITYRDGHSCSLGPDVRLEAAYRAFARTALAKLGRPKPGPAGHLNPRWMAHYRRLLEGFLSRQHLTMRQFREELGPFPSCPAVGWVASKGPRITAADVATPIVIRELPSGRYGCPTPAKLRLPQGCNGYSPAFKQLVPVEWSFKAREAVKNSRSWYQWSVSPVSGQAATNCGGSSFATYANVSQGQVLRYSQLFPTTCRGKYTITVGFMASAPPRATDDTNGGGDGLPGRDGSLLVGRATFTIR